MKLQRKGNREVSKNAMVYLNEGGCTTTYQLNSPPNYNLYSTGGAAIDETARALRDTNRSIWTEGMVEGSYGKFKYTLGGILYFIYKAVFFH